MKKIITFAVIIILIAANILAADINIYQRQNQIKNLKQKFIELSKQSVDRKYFVTYEGYEIKQIKENSTILMILYKIHEDQNYHKKYNEILKNLSENESNSENYRVGGNYRIENGQLINDQYNISEDIPVNLIEDIPIQLYINGIPTGTCRIYRDNLQVDFSFSTLLTNITLNFPKAFIQEMAKDQDQDTESIRLNPNLTNSAIKNSKIIPVNGLSMKQKFTTQSQIGNIRLSIKQCENEEHRHWRNK